MVSIVNSDVIRSFTSIWFDFQLNCSFFYRSVVFVGVIPLMKWFIRPFGTIMFKIWIVFIVSFQLLKTWPGPLKRVIERIPCSLHSPNPVLAHFYRIKASTNKTLVVNNSRSGIFKIVGYVTRYLVFEFGTVFNEVIPLHVQIVDRWVSIWAWYLYRGTQWRCALAHKLCSNGANTSGCCCLRWNTVTTYISTTTWLASCSRGER